MSSILHYINYNTASFFTLILPVVLLVSVLKFNNNVNNKESIYLFCPFVLIIWLFMSLFLSKIQ